MKAKFYLIFLLATLLTILQSCNNAKKPEITSTTGDSKIVNASGIPKTQQDTEIKQNVTVSKIAGNTNQDAINYLVPENIKEMIWLKSAVDRGISKDLRASAMIMLSDQKKLAKQLANLVSKEHYSVPTIDTTNVVTINDKMATDWDKAWNGKMVADHMQDLNMLAKAKVDVTDPELKTIIIKDIPVVQSHLNMAQALDKKIR